MESTTIQMPEIIRVGAGYWIYEEPLTRIEEIIEKEIIPTERLKRFYVSHSLTARYVPESRTIQICLHHGYSLEVSDQIDLVFKSNGGCRALRERCTEKADREMRGLAIQIVIGLDTDLDAVMEIEELERDMYDTWNLEHTDYDEENEED